MSLVTVDTTNPESMERPPYEPLEPGVYELRITNRLEVKPSANPSKKDGVNHGRIEVKLEELASGKTVTDDIPMSPNMKWKLNQFAAAAGVAEIEPGQVDLDDFQGLIVQAEIGQRTYTRNDQTTGLANEVNKYLYESASTPA